MRAEDMVQSRGTKPVSAPSIWLIVVPLLLLAAACSEPADVGDAAAVETSSIAATTVAPTTTVASATTTAPTTTAATTTTRYIPPSFEVIASDYMYEGLPESMPFASSLSLVNSSDTEFHELILVFFGDDETPLEELSQRTVDELANHSGAHGGLTSIVYSRPGEPAYRHDQNLSAPVMPRAGRWVIFCSVPVGADPAVAEKDVDAPLDHFEGTPRHYEQGEIAEFYVEAP